MSAGNLSSMLHPLILSNNKSRLRKDQNLCFVNSTLQVLYSIDDFRLFFQSEQAHGFPTSFPVCREIAKLFRSKGEYEVSASELRRIVGMTSQKSYLSNGGQQDAEEFLRTLIEQLMVELPAGHTFLPSLQSFWGKEKTSESLRLNEDDYSYRLFPQLVFVVEDLNYCPLVGAWSLQHAV